jgi:hypothetical protein
MSYVKISKRSVMKIILFLSLGFCLAGCSKKKYNATIKQASFDHSCPEKNVKIISTSKKKRILNVCGKTRTYKWVKGGFVDITTNHKKDVIFTQ